MIYEEGFVFDRRLFIIQINLYTDFKLKMDDNKCDKYAIFIL